MACTGTGSALEALEELSKKYSTDQPEPPKPTENKANNTFDDVENDSNTTYAELEQRYAKFINMSPDSS